MKSQLIFIAIITLSLSVKAQIYTPGGIIQGISSNNNIGIGTNTPAVTLDVNSTDVAAFFKSATNSVPVSIISTGNSISTIGFKGAASINEWNVRVGVDGNDLVSYTGNLERMRINANGNVGIGKNPNQRLDVNGNGLFNGAIISSISTDTGGHIELVNPSKNGNGSASTWKIFNMTGVYGNSLQFWAYDNLGCVGGMCNNRFTIMDNGNVGIGTMISDSKLDVSTDLPSQGRYDSQKWSVKNDNYDLKLQTIWNANAINQEFIQRYNGVNYTSLAFYKGKIGIGTSNPDEQLTVNGKIHAQEVRIDLSSPMTVPDYVFANDYKLKSLHEVEDYIKQNSHLPEIPSAKEIEKDGLMLAEMNMALLKKIEELTLYMIEQEKKNTLQSKEIDILKKENLNFQLIIERVVKLENQTK